MTVAELRGHGEGPAPLIEKAARAILAPGLSSIESPLDPNTVTWDIPVVQHLRRLLSHEEESATSAGAVGTAATYTEVLRRQLEGAPTAVILLATELLFLQQVPLSTVTPVVKRARIHGVLSVIGTPVQLPPEMEDALGERGPLTGGLGFNVQLREHLLWLCNFVESWLQLSEEDRLAALTEPAEFQRVAAAVPGDWKAIRYSLQYLAWPTYFQPIVKHRDKLRIRDAFADRIGGPSGIEEADIDRDLAGIAAQLRADTGEAVQWYSGKIADQWQRYRDDHSRRAWLIRPGRRGAAQVTDWLDQNRVSLPALHLARLPSGASKQEVAAAVEQGYPHDDYQARFQLTSEIHTFLSRMNPQDLVVVQSGPEICIGTLTDDVGFVDDGGQHVERSVRWHDTPIALDKVPGTVSDLLEEPGSIVDLTAALDTLLALTTAGLGHHEAEFPLAPAEQAGTVPNLPEVTQEFADELEMDRASLQGIVDTLQTRQQIVFYGPPGTGKTYLAQELARHLAGLDDPGRVQLVQFHPSYSYEDFFEGYRPTLTESGQPGFQLQAGPLRRQAARAASEAGRDHPSFLIIDEMNRADLARVFGELYFLLEYRDRTVMPQYSPHTGFRLPRNLFIIGTMNTADRSIAMVDAAIRRRFAFIELHPDEPPVAGLLHRRLAKAGQDTLPAALLDELNARIDDADRDLRIGPSYLMAPEAGTEEGLQRIWRYDLLPLLEEHYYGRLSRRQIHERFGLEPIRQHVQRYR